MLKNEQGSTIIMAMIILLIVMQFGMVLLSRGIYSIKESHLDIAEEKARYVARSAVNAVVYELQNNSDRLDMVLKATAGGKIYPPKSETTYSVEKKTYRPQGETVDGSRYCVTITQPDNEHLLVEGRGEHSNRVYSTKALLKISRKGVLFNNNAALATTRIDVDGASKEQPLIIDGDLIVRANIADEAEQTLNNIAVTENLFAYANNQGIHMSNITATTMEFDATEDVNGAFNIKNCNAENFHINIHSDGTIQGNEFKNIQIAYQSGNVIMNDSNSFNEFELYFTNTSQEDGLEFGKFIPWKNATENYLSIYGPNKGIKRQNEADREDNDNLSSINLKAGSEWSEQKGFKGEPIIDSSYNIGSERLSLVAPDFDKIEKYMGANIHLTPSSVKLPSGATPLEKIDFLEKYGDSDQFNEEWTTMSYDEYTSIIPSKPDENPIMAHIVFHKENVPLKVIDAGGCKRYEYDIIQRRDDPEYIGYDHYFIFVENREYDQFITVDIDYNTELKSVVRGIENNAYLYIHSPKTPVSFVSLPEMVEGSFILAGMYKGANEFGDTLEDVIKNNGPVTIKFREQPIIKNETEVGILSGGDVTIERYE